MGRSKRELQSLKKLASEHFKHGKPLLHDPLFAARVAQLEIELMALEITALRVLTRDQQAPGPEASLLKIRGSEIQQWLSELMMEALGPGALPFDTAYLAGEASTPSRATTARRRWRPTTSTCARPRSTAAPTRFRKTSSPG